MADVGVRQVLIPVADGDGLVLVMEDVHSRTVVDQLHELRSQRIEHAIGKVNKSAIAGEELLYAGSRRPGCRSGKQLCLRCQLNLGAN
jgi:hypothetical protein